MLRNTSPQKCNNLEKLLKKQTYNRKGQTQKLSTCKFPLTSEKSGFYPKVSRDLANKMAKENKV